MTPRRGLGVALLATAGLATVPAGAVAASAPGTTTIRPTGTAGQALAKQVRIGAARPATAKRTAWTLAVASGTVGRSAATLDHRGELRLRAGRRSLRISAVRTVLGRRSSLRARVGGRTVTVFTIAPARKRPPRYDAGARRVRLDGASLRLTAAGASALRRGLRLRRLAAGRFGTVAVRATLPAPAPPAPGGPTVPGPGPIAPGPPPGPAPGPVCATTDPGDVRYPDGYPAVPPASAAPPVRWTLRTSLVDYLLRRWASVAPASDPLCSQGWGRLVGTGGAAVGVSADGAASPPAASIVSLVDSGNAGQPDRAGVFAAYRATPDASYAATTADATRYRSRFTVAAVERDPASDEVILQLRGTVHLDMPAHLIDTRISDPRIVIAADRQQARLYADGRDSGAMADALAGTPRPKRWQQLPLLDLDLSQVTPTDGDGIRTWTAVPATVAPDAPGATPDPQLQHSAAAALGSGQYPAGSPFGTLTIAVPLAELGP
ncbi:HtaA domain-containing protein [Patulibacter defluvii]|uniref:HtaA domain-containing protein n=1 Tax=Patulibacter defluvii TaxID=3095358 RepID=UPI002A7533C3|nr:HtaA domain-containing protein [Patulibacter sp. DM4]